MPAPNSNAAVSPAPGFAASLDYLHSLGWELRPGRKFDLAEIGAVLAELGHPERAFPAVHIAGTNAKGSVAALIESAARAAGWRTGLYTSPHLQHLTERVRVGGRELTPTAFAASTQAVRAAVERLLARSRLPHAPSFFEGMTAVGFHAFAAARVELAVVEVGMGGRLDATNVLQPRLAVITPIGLDHEAYLGHDLATIAGEKAGIIKPGLEGVVVAPQPPAVMAVIQAAGDRAGVPLWPVAAAGTDAAPATPLPGRHQRLNAAVAALACRRLGLAEDAIRAGFAAVRWPGRLEKVQDAPEVFLDGAHNPAAARALAEFLDDRRADHPAPILIYGTMRDKAVEEICEILFPRAQAVILTAPRQPRALAPSSLAAACAVHAAAWACAADFPAALRRALQLSAAAGGAAIFITGSLYLVGEARDHWFPRGTEWQ